MPDGSQALPCALWAVGPQVVKACEWIMCIQSGLHSSLLCVDSPMVDTNLAYRALM